MTNTDAQLYTIEGLAAALIMIITAYMVVNATSVYTAGDTHINDMQLEALGTDALKVMDANETELSLSPLRTIITHGTPANNASFGTRFQSLINNGTTSSPDHIQFSASYSYRDISDNSVKKSFINASRIPSIGEHAVRATKWVIADNRAVLVEVLMWRD